MGHWTDFFPYIAMAFKVLVLCVGGFFAIKWHFDKDKELKEKEAKAKSDQRP